MAKGYVPSQKEYNNKPDDTNQKSVAIKTFYKTADNNTADKVIRSDLFDDVAKKIAGSFASEKGGVSYTQLRRMYDEAKRFEQLLDADEKNWEKELPYIKMMKSKICYAVARAVKDKGKYVKDYYKNFASFISEGIDLIKDEQDYRVFISLFEAVCGFYYENAPKN
mgnify:FL=1